MNFMNWVLDRLKEKSTWRGFVAALAGLGLYISPELADAIVVLGLGIAGFLEVVWPEKSEKKEGE